MDKNRILLGAAVARATGAFLPATLGITADDSGAVSMLAVGVLAIVVPEAIGL